LASWHDSFGPMLVWFLEEISWEHRRVRVSCPLESTRVWILVRISCEDQRVKASYPLESTRVWIFERISYEHRKIEVPYPFAPRFLWILERAFCEHWRVDGLSHLYIEGSSLDYSVSIAKLKGLKHLDQFGYESLNAIGCIHGWGTTFGTKDLRTMSHWISAFIMIYYYSISKFQIDK